MGSNLIVMYAAASSPDHHVVLGLLAMLPPKVRLPLPFFSSEPAPETGVLKLLASLRLKRKMAPEAIKAYDGVVYVGRNAASETAVAKAPPAAKKDPAPAPATRRATAKKAPAAKKAIAKPASAATLIPADQVTKDMILADLRGQMFALREAFVFVLEPPSVPGIGTGGGLKGYVQDRAARGLPALEGATWALAGTSRSSCSWLSTS